MRWGDKWLAEDGRPPLVLTHKTVRRARSTRASSAGHCDADHHRRPGSRADPDRARGRRCRHDRRPPRRPARRAARRRPGPPLGRHRRPRHLLAQGVHPAHHAVPGQVRLLHVRPAAGPRSRRRTSRRSRCSPSPGPAPRPAATRRSSPSASGPSCATRSPQEWLRDHGYETTVDYLVAMCRARARGDRAAPPRQRRRAARATSWPSCGPSRASQGMMLESLQRPTSPATAARPTRTPARRLATLEAAGELRHPLHHRHPRAASARPRPGPARRPRRHRRDPRPPRPRAGGDRPELPAEGGHGDAQRPAVPGGRVPLVDRRRPPRPAGRRPPAGAAQPERRLRPSCSTPASTTGAASPPSPPTT